MIGWLLAAGVALAVAGIVAPVALKPIFVALTVLALPIGLIVGELMMLLIYFGVFMPIGLLLRLRKRDALELKYDRLATTYWKPKKQPTDVSSYYRQS